MSGLTIEEVLADPDPWTSYHWLRANLPALVEAQDPRLTFKERMAANKARESALHDALIREANDCNAGADGGVHFSLGYLCSAVAQYPVMAGEIIESLQRCHEKRLAAQTARSSQ